MRIEAGTTTKWLPLGTSRRHRPEEGDLLAHKHAVWRVIHVEDLQLTDEDRDTWIRLGMPNLATWGGRPYRITVEWEGGVKPDWAERDDGSRRGGSLDIRAGSFKSWDVYADGRWPQCSCCGEPMPCRAKLEDRQVTAGLDRIAKLEAIPPGACWACHEPVTTRQKSVTYQGDNIDLPGGPSPQFHLRGKCRPSAQTYEEKWVAADPRRERILTWPHCAGALIVHADGSSECVAGLNPLGEDHVPQPDCRGHLTHDHGYLRACYVDSECTRGCKLEDHHGTATTPRPERRESSVGGLFQ